MERSRSRGKDRMINRLDSHARIRHSLSPVKKFGHNLDSYSNMLKQSMLEQNPAYTTKHTGEEKDISQLRKISKVPYKVLDAPKLRDDFYYQLVDWSTQNSVIVGLDQSAFTWNPKTNETVQLFDLDNQIASVKWSQISETLAVGDEAGTVRIYDITKAKIIRQYENHSLRVGCLDWDGYNITSGSRDRSILLSDIRVPGSAQMQLNGHKQEVCGLSWNSNEVLASGGNDNNVVIQSLRMPSQPIYSFKQHTAAVKALAWSPHQSHVLCTGGGTSDKTLKLWNTATGQLQASVDSGSQICNMKWSRNSDEIVTTHGYSLNQIAVWKASSLERIATLEGHSFRVLYLAMSPDGENIVTGSGDETLRFWKVFPQTKKPQIQSSTSRLSLDLR